MDKEKKKEKINETESGKGKGGHSTQSTHPVSPETVQFMDKVGFMKLPTSKHHLSAAVGRVVVDVVVIVLADQTEPVVLDLVACMLARLFHALALQARAGDRLAGKLMVGGEQGHIDIFSHVEDVAVVPRVVGTAPGPDLPLRAFEAHEIPGAIVVEADALYEHIDNGRVT